MIGDCGEWGWRAARALALSLVLAAAVPVPVGAEDRHAGYYYPEVTSTEIYHSRAETLPDSDRSRRVGFVTGVTAGQTERPYYPITAMYAKGTGADKLIMIGLHDGPMDTLYRARALLAMLTATSRTTAVFRELDPQGNYTFLDLLKILGFTRLTLSDGKTWAHQIEIH